MLLIRNDKKMVSVLLEGGALVDENVVSRFAQKEGDDTHQEIVALLQEALSLKIQIAQSHYNRQKILMFGYQLWLIASFDTALVI